METSGALIGKRVREARLRLGLNQTELATKIGVKPAYVNSLEAGRFKRPSAERVSALARALGVKITDLTEAPNALPPDLLTALEAMDDDDRALVADVVNEVRDLGPEERASALRFAIQSVRAIRAARPR